MGFFIEKIFDLTFDAILKMGVYLFNGISPVKINPRRMKSDASDEWVEIRDLKITNRLNSELYDIYVEGLSADGFDITTISDDTPIGKTVEHMNVNTNHVAVMAKDQVGKKVWLFRIQKLNPKEVVNLKIKVQSTSEVQFTVLQYSAKESPVRERKDGVVSIPFKLKKYPDFRR
ncbi:MAG: hypothetical protein UY63_C0017G0010 [Parcubacteria group bacterium GW2011_GWA2_51_10]|nr:MAG: hypothetical protein UY63_C0017G0010 [Parcubacteria group bacterium GW2011_GWA2_51_10]